ncbi:hypothetical protein Ppa06_47430 [Planomonospora parontospora subsp. parontospora]|uniref:Uncharacterized protein n=2 Tax=Planomonospora parontospora TaxID=58119 RepID=A0AA37F689_9ACTN|nr:hypothetical protein GCM10010126_47180 [Planomonospora parontospora]GII10945.1 hypothetical protein Ppa06_47430 [Planomonospora parontospora subsp. parontospora]
MTRDERLRLTYDGARLERGEARTLNSSSVRRVTLARHSQLGPFEGHWKWPFGPSGGVTYDTGM